MAKLTKAQREMLRLCIDQSAAWVTSPMSPAAGFLSEWETQGWAEKCEAPADFLVAYRFTPAGRAALAEER
jgi:hypothetical protein